MLDYPHFTALYPNSSICFFSLKESDEFGKLIVVERSV